MKRQPLRPKLEAIYEERGKDPSVEARVLAEEVSTIVPLLYDEVWPISRGRGEMADAADLNKP